VTDWIAAGSLVDIPENKPALVMAGETELLLFRSGESLFAVSNRCTHQGAQLHRGVARSSGSLVTITCPAHGSTFALGDGRVLRGPASTPITAWETRVVDGVVEVRSRD